MKGIAPGRACITRFGRLAVALAMIGTALIAAGCRAYATPAPEMTLELPSAVPIGDRTCNLKPMRPEAAASLSKDGAIIVLERNGGMACDDELYAIYPGGRTVSTLTDGTTISGQLAPGEVDELLADISDAGFFTDLFQTTYHPPCAACYQYSVTVTYEGQSKTVGAVDGGVDAAVEYWIVVGQVEFALGVEY